MNPVQRAVLGRALLCVASCTSLGFGAGYPWIGALIGGVIAVVWVTAWALDRSGQTSEYDN